MNKVHNINKILNQIELLDYNSKLSLMEKLVGLLKSKQEIHSSSMLSLKGVGKNIWGDVDKFLQDERQWE